jgi:hypothetical protein
MIKMVVSSFYNTLINDEEAIPTSTMLEIERIRKKGIVFSVCTNRLYKDILEYNKDFPFIDYIVSLNGAYIYDVKREKYLSKKKITATTVKKLVNIFSGYKVLFYSEDNVYEDYNETLDKEIYKLEIEVDKKEDVEEKLQKQKVNYSFFYINNKCYLEIISNSSSMFSGVDKIALKCNLTLDSILTISANESDISLIHNIPNSYIVSNSSELLKKETKRTTLSNNEKGVERIIKKTIK